jgi:hypothetical protein
MSAHPEEILYEAVHGGEASHLGGRLEAPHLALALARRLMRDFSAIVLVLTRARKSTMSEEIARLRSRARHGRWRPRPVRPGAEEHVPDVRDGQAVDVARTLAIEPARQRLRDGVFDEGRAIDVAQRQGE